jgi:hypothetical protein
MAHPRDTRWQIRVDNAAWREECGSCHMAYPPAMLSSVEWLHIMTGLEQHFGSNAGLEADKRQEIEDFLDRYGIGQGTPPASRELPRISTRAWFIDKHRGAIRLWKQGRLKTLSDCLSCHKAADQEPAPDQPVK